MNQTLSLKEIQNIQYEILKDVVNYCVDNGIRYFLSYGTLLGAIRHKGFIPWDDDIDISMPRTDYIRFVTGYNSKCNPIYKCCSINVDKDYAFTYAKVFDRRTRKHEQGIDYNIFEKYGIDIDIFPIDGLPRTIKESNRFFRKQRRWFFWYSLSVSKYVIGKSVLLSIPRFIVIKFCKLIGSRRFIEKINSNSTKYNFELCEFIGVSVSPYNGNKERMKKDDIFDLVKVEFVDNVFNCPRDFTLYLTRIYGDFMKVPPEDKRKSHHGFTAEWINFDD